MATETGLESLAGTMTAQQILDLMERNRAAHAARISADAEGAAEAAQQAEEAYTTAAAAPPPSISLIDRVIPTLLGNIASTVGRDPTFRERTQTNLQEQTQQLMRARQENLTALRDSFKERADEARRLGDQETAINLSMKQDQLDKQLQMLLEKQREGAADRRALEDRQARQQEAAADRRAAMERTIASGLLDLGIDPKTGEMLRSPKGSTKTADDYQQSVEGIYDSVQKLKLDKKVEPGAAKGLLQAQLGPLKRFDQTLGSWTAERLLTMKDLEGRPLYDLSRHKRGSKKGQFANPEDAEAFFTAAAVAFPEATPQELVGALNETLQFSAQVRGEGPPRAPGASPTPEAGAPERIREIQKEAEKQLRELRGAKGRALASERRRAANRKLEALFREARELGYNLAIGVEGIDVSATR